MWRRAAFIRQFSSAVPGDAQRGKRPQLIPRHTLGPEAGVRGWAASPQTGREERLVIRIPEVHAQDIVTGSQWENPRSGFPFSALEVGNKNASLLFKHLSPPQASCSRQGYCLTPRTWAAHGSSSQDCLPHLLPSAEHPLWGCV